MAGPDRSKAILAGLEGATYYGILNVSPEASEAAIRDAFHVFALQYHPDRYVGESREDAKLAMEVFKRGTEAFVVLTDAAIRPLYDDGLKRGHLRYIAGEAAQAALDALPKVKTLEQIAQKPKAKELAMRADRLLVADKVEAARILLSDAVQEDFDNLELKARLDALYTLGGVETLSDVKANARPVAPPPRVPAAPAASATSAAPPAPPKPRTLEEIAATPKAKELARKADRLLSVGKTEEARVVLTDAVQDDFDNPELRARLNALYTADGYEQF